ncbi:MAG: hypothetical protein HN909_02685 [Phycisphaerales bacterium]|jgi:hypothetical protein|nr:hypothetical protein [Phycisphaerales bacterium]MBT7170658.1 hypothetical protein [Phycisphaerales bacterium]
MIDWIQTNYKDVFAIVGTLYIAARGVVALTPTPADDSALDTVSAWLKTIGNLFGLDLTQGRDEK